MRSDNAEGREPTFIERARRAQIMAATERTVAKRGYAGASLAQIAAEAEISKSVISYHFEGKRELMHQTMDTFFTEAWEHMLQRLDAQATPTDKIATWVRAQIEFFTQHRERFTAAIVIMMGIRDSDGSPILNEYAEDEIEALSALLAEGQAAGEFREFDTRAYAMVISQLVEGALGAWMWNESVDIASQTRAVEDFIHYAISGGSS